jgi:aerobic-type carbon monoxide dehydrogenase small subunit (CoxS/CutS family)
MHGNFIINGKPVTVTFHADETLLSVLRSCGNTEVKEGCGEGQCGSCLVVLNGRLVNSCQVLAGSVPGAEILTVRGLGDIHVPHPIQTAFVEAGAVQCGFCTPGMVMAAHYLLTRKPDPSDEEIRKALDGNLCRCTGYVKIIDAVRLAAGRMGEHG